MDLVGIRAVAKEYGLKEIDLSKTNSVVAYVSPFRSFRVNIYFQTGSSSLTVVTQILHPKCGLCQLIRYGVTEQLLKEIIRNPEAHAGISKYQGKVGKVPFGPCVPQSHLNGHKMWFVGLRGFRDNLKINYKPSRTLTFAVGPDSYLAIGIKGKAKYHAWWVNIPKALKATLRKREYELPSPISAALGSGDRYFIKYSNGSFEWVASKGFSKLIKRFPKVAKVAFGADWDSYHVLFMDGTQAWNGLPVQLEKILERRKDSQPDVVEVSLCPDNPAFFHVIFADGSWRSHGVPQVMEKQLYYGHCRVQFAGKGQCLITYNEDVADDEEFQDEFGSGKDSDSEQDAEFEEMSYTDGLSDEEKLYPDDEWVTGKN